MSNQPSNQAEINHPEGQEQADMGTRRSGFMVRLLIFALALVAVCGIGSLIIFQLMRSSRNQPIEVETYPGASVLSEVKETGKDTRLFETAASPQQVYGFYTERLGDEKKGEEDGRGCTKIYTTAQPSENLGDYYIRCIVDNSQDDITQRVLITATYDATDSKTRIEIVREWGGK